MAQNNFAYATNIRDPRTAALLSVIPGLGQFYNGESRKGFLFLDVAIINYVLLSVILLSPGIAKAMQEFGHQFGMKVNHAVIDSLSHVQFGSPVSLVVSGLVLSFIAYAVRDAYDQALARRRKAIYRDAVIELPEATSGSYIIHASLIVTLAIMAMFFFIPSPIAKQMIEIEFLDTHIHNTQTLVQSQRHTHENNIAKIKQFDHTKPVVKTPPKADVSKQQQAERTAAATSNQSAQLRRAATSSSSSTSMARTQVKPIAPPTTHQETAKPVLIAHAFQPPAPAAIAPLKPAMGMSAMAPMLQKMATAAAVTPNPNPMPKTIAASNPATVPMPAAMHAGTSSAIPLPLPSQLQAGSLQRGNSGTTMPLPASTSGGLANAVQLPGVGPMPALGGNTGATPHLGPIGPSSRNTGFSTSTVGPVEIGHSATGPATTTGPVEMGRGHHIGKGTKTGSDPDGDSDIPAPARAGKHSNSGDGPIRIVPSAGSPITGPGDKSMNFAGPKGDTTVPDTTKDVDFSAYMADLQRRIKRAWFPPKNTEKNRVKVMFKIHNGGEMSNLRISETSGLAIADQAALQAIQSAAPFRHLPPGAPENVDIEFTFDYNVFKMSN